MVLCFANVLGILTLLLLPVLAAAQEPCPPTPVFSPCDVVFEIPPEEATAHSNPYLSVEMHAEFRSPRHKTLMLPAFWDGGRRMVIRFTPTGAGLWDYRVSSNVKAFDGKLGKLTATESGSPGFIQPANVHHWGHTGQIKPHLWMGDTCYTLAWIEEDLFRRIVETRAEQKFNHMRGLLMHNDETKYRKAFLSPDQPDPAHFQQVDKRVRILNEKGITWDLVIAGDQNHLARLFPQPAQRERLVRYLVARYSGFHITWQGVQEFEEYTDARELLKEIGLLLKKMDPYQHPRSTHTVSTSAPLLSDGWMTHIVYQSSDDALGSIEHQLYGAPQVNTEFGYEDSGAGKSHPHHVDSDTFRKRLWNAAMNGQYVTFGNTGTYGGRAFPVDARYLDSPGARAMKAYFEFFSNTRYWELQPFFDVEGGRALSLPGIEYIVYLEKPGPVEVATEKHGYDVYWFNPSTGELRKEKKSWKGERFTGEPPDKNSDWVLHLSRDGRKRSMLNSYKFESRRTLLQEIESNSKNVPYAITEPEGDTIPAEEAVRFSSKLTRETRASRAMRYLWTVESTTASNGYRVIGSGAEGSFRVPKSVAQSLPAVLNLRLLAINANGKVYSLDRIYKLAP